MREKICFEEMDYYIVQNHRIFIDIAQSGCGSGCRYCYVKSKDEQQALLSQQQVEQICNHIRKHHECRGMIVSLCPNTEPLKSQESKALVLYVLRFFLACGSYLQISTKEKIPEEYLAEVNRIAKGRVYINVSVPFLKESMRIEPYAGNITDRIETFCYIRKYESIHFCLYIKPFTNHALQYAQQYIDLINKYGIESVFVGVQFDLDIEQPCQSLYLEKKATKLLMEQKERIALLIKQLRSETKACVFGSSICQIHNDFDIPCSLQLYNHSKNLCSDCNRCTDYSIKEVL